MGIRGYIILKYKGMYYVLYDRWADINGTGVGTVKSINKLCDSFNGNITLWFVVVIF